MIYVLFITLKRKETGNYKRLITTYIYYITVFNNYYNRTFNFIKAGPLLAPISYAYSRIDVVQNRS